VNNGCVGLCCSCFNLRGQQPAAVGAGDPENMHLILTMLQPLPALDAETGWQLYTCRFWNRETKMCNIYEDRPQMCRDFPAEGQKCGWEGCTFPSGDKEADDAG